MSFSSKLREAEELGAKAAHLGAQRAKDGLLSLEARLHKLGASRKAEHANQPVSAHADPEQDRESSPNSKVRTGIVSVNGRDVGEMRCTGGRNPRT